MENPPTAQNPSLCFSCGSFHLIVLEQCHEPHLSQSKLKILLGPDVHPHCLLRFWCIRHLLCFSLCDGDAGPKQATFHMEAGIPVLRRSPPAQEMTVQHTQLTVTATGSVRYREWPLEVNL